MCCEDEVMMLQCEAELLCVCLNVNTVPLLNVPALVKVRLTKLK